MQTWSLHHRRDCRIHRGIINFGESSTQFSHLPGACSVRLYRLKGFQCGHLTLAQLHMPVLCQGYAVWWAAGLSWCWVDNWSTSDQQVMLGQQLINNPLVWGERSRQRLLTLALLLALGPSLEPGPGTTRVAVRHTQGSSLPAYPVSSLGSCTMCLTGLACFKLLIQSGHEGCAPWITRLLNFDMLVSKLSKPLNLFPGDCVNKQGAAGISPKFVGQEAFLMPSLKHTCACFPQRKIWCSEHVSPKQMKRKMQAMLFRSLIQQWLSGFKLWFW